MPSKTVLITGASSGLGMASSLYLAAKGYSVIGTSRAMDRLAPLRNEATARSLPITPVELDINDDDDVGRVVPALIEEHGTIDVLVNNAGYGLWGPVESLSISELRAQFETNLFAAVRLIKCVLPGMLEQRSGTIINVSSVLGRLGTPFNGAYVSSKFALEGLSESLRAELQPFGVRVAVIEPGLFETNFHANTVVADRARSGDLVYAPYLQVTGEESRRFRRLSSDATRVAKAIDRIVRSRRPAFRHPVGSAARLGILGARLLPERLFHALVVRATRRGPKRDV